MTVGQTSSVTTKTRLAERRQVTALSYDLVGSTRLAARLDPEDLRSLQRLFHETCTNAVAHFGGYIGRYTGDGAMAYFGYPQAHEDDPERAVRAGLAIVADSQALNAAGKFPEATIAVRVGIATGLVVAGDFAGNRAYDQDDVVGIAPNLAFKLQAAGAPNTVIISGTTRELTAGLFQCRARPPLLIGGFDQPQSVWQVLRARTRITRSWSARLQSVTPLVARDDEMLILRRRWEMATQGEGQIVLLSGEPGIGKSRIVTAMKDYLAEQRHFSVTLQCSSQESDTAFHPVIRLLERLVGTRRPSANTIAQRLSQLLGEPVSALGQISPHLAQLLGQPGADSPAHAPEEIKQQTMQALIDLIERMSRQRPVLLICEDIHWIDPTSQEFLDLFLEQATSLRVLVLVTFRSTYQARWIGQPHVSLLALSRLSDRNSAAMVSYLARDRIVSQTVIDRIVSLGDGVPLFIEELSRSVFGSSTNATAEPVIPATLSDSLAARLDQLGNGREVAQICSVIGRSFSASLVCRVSGHDEASVNRDLENMVSAGIAKPTGWSPQATYTFRHALIQESAYRSMLRPDRQAIHRRVADLLAVDYAGTSDGAPEILAHHYEQAGAAQEAVTHLHNAARNAVARSANVEAVRLLERALRMLATVPENAQREATELALLVSLGPPRLGISGPGAPEVQTLYGRAIQLCDRLPGGPHHFAAHWGWWFTSKDNREALDRANRLSRLTEQLRDDELELQAHHCHWATQFCLGDHQRTIEHIKAGLKIYERGDFRLHSTLYGGHDPKVCALGEWALSLWLTGDYESSLRASEQGMSHAQALSQTGGLRHSRDQQIMLYRYRGDAEKVQKLAEEMAAYAEEEGFKGLAAQAKVFGGWASAKLGDAEGGVRLINLGLAEHMAINTPEDLPVYYEMVAEAYGEKGEPENGLPFLEEAMVVAERTGLQTWSAELFRRKGALLLQQSRRHKSEARACFSKAIDIARAQGARALLLRALCDMVGIAEEAERPDARQSLAVLCANLTEGHGYPDVAQARRLLDGLR